MTSPPRRKPTKARTKKVPPAVRQTSAGPSTTAPAAHAEWLAEVKARKQRAALVVNRETWPEADFVQHPVGQLPSGHNLVLLTNPVDARTKIRQTPSAESAQVLAGLAVPLEQPQRDLIRERRVVEARPIRPISKEEGDAGLEPRNRKYCRLFSLRYWGRRPEIRHEARDEFGAGVSVTSLVTNPKVPTVAAFSGRLSWTSCRALLAVNAPAAPALAPALSVRRSVEAR